VGGVTVTSEVTILSEENGGGRTTSLADLLLLGTGRPRKSRKNWKQEIKLGKVRGGVREGKGKKKLPCFTWNRTLLLLPSKKEQETIVGMVGDEGGGRRVKVESYDASDAGGLGSR